MTQAAPMNLVVLLGSLRQGSYNKAIATSLQELAPPQVNVTLLGSVGDLPHYDADIEKACYPQALFDMAEQIRAADGLIIVSPEYNYSVPGALKNAIDWLSRLENQPIANKPVLIQSASMGILGGARMQYHLRQILVFLNAHVMNTPEVMVGRAQDKVDAQNQLIDAGTREFIGMQLSQFAAFAHLINAR